MYDKEHQKISWEWLQWRIIQLLAVGLVCSALFFHWNPAALSVLPALAEPEVEETSKTITIFVSGFSPQRVALVPGDEVTWQNATTETVNLYSGWPKEQYIPLVSLDSGGSSQLAAVKLKPAFQLPELIVTLPPGGSFSQQFPRDGRFLFHTDTISPYLNAIVVGDRDRDRLPDDVETNDGNFIDDTRTGTDPDNPDTDSDGILDGDEILGTEDGLDLPALGANPLRKNIFIEYDWLEYNDSEETYIHRPMPESLARISQVFRDAPIKNPDGSTGISLHHDYGQGNGFHEGNLIPDADGVLAGDILNGEFVSYKAAHFDDNRLGFFHYVILAHRFGSTDPPPSGLAELRGDDMIISLQDSHDNIDFLAAAIMHELGHNLGLDHGGDSPCNFKPNYNSIMNYRFEFFGIDDRSCDAEGDGVAVNLDYSEGNRLTLDETNLNEIVGVCGTQPIDFNDNGIINNPIVPVIFDVNFYDRELSECGGLLTTLSDYNDWASIDLTALTEENNLRTAPRLIEEASLAELTQRD
ncbi:MAG: hypothetical protein AAF633_12635 [Chloroflexota bacterium]